MVALPLNSFWESHFPLFFPVMCRAWFRRKSKLCSMNSSRMKRSLNSQSASGTQSAAPLLLLEVQRILLTSSLWRSALEKVGPLWRHDMETLPVLLAFCEGTLLMTDEFPYRGLVNSSPLVLHLCVHELGRHWFRQWLVAYSAPSHYLNQCRVIANWISRNKLQWNFIEIHNFSFPKMHLKIPSAEWRPFCAGKMSKCFLWCSPQ